MEALGLGADSSTYSKSHGATESLFFLGLEREPRDLGITPPLQSPDPSHLVKHRALRKYSQDTHWTPRVDAPITPWKTQCGFAGILKLSPSWVTSQEMLDASPSGGWSQVICHPSLSPMGSLQVHFPSLQP